MTVTSKSRSTESTQPHWLEWLVGAVSAVLIIAMTGWIAGEAILHQETAPEFRVENLATQVVKDGFRVEFEIFNDGTSTAAAVKVRGELIRGGQVTETAETTFDYVPGRSSSRGGLFFSQSPAGGDIRIRALGYTEP
ncbi:TIGR02588 family protein [Rhizobium halophilum]|uniref:TIGR02588 family protein n=1 Tax=Rhizobium halophilum TaxID=2846852 RepID=UPI001EFE540F|nr:TIGR02588 family protein [Rhizobium halophilum]MCF6370278.1 TIGR02588 family protein [Rhizobium halophilum]